MQIYTLQSGPRHGVYNMALDETLLEWARRQPTAVLVARTYTWTLSTLSLGVNQPDKDWPALQAVYPDAACRVRRPTGGRAILHGEDISYSLVSNAPALLAKPLKASFCELSALVTTALTTLGIPLQTDCQASDQAYARSPVCFETRCPTDLRTAGGQKIAGAAQRRRKHGILQHGTVFPPAPLPEAEFASALFDAVSTFYSRPVAPFPLSEIACGLQTLLPHYQNESDRLSMSTREKALTTAGSHFAPASS